MIPFAVIHIMLTFIIICCNSISQKKLLIKLKSQASHALSLIISVFDYLSLPLSLFPTLPLTFSLSLLSFFPFFFLSFSYPHPLSSLSLLISLSLSFFLSFFPSPLLFFPFLLLAFFPSHQSNGRYLPQQQ